MSIPHHPELDEIIRSIAAGEDVADDDFDRLLPKAMQKLSRVHWTPIAVAKRATTWLTSSPGARVLDVGSGVGKLCIVGALTTKGLFTGVERHRPFVELAKALVKRYHISNVGFQNKDILDIDWSRYDGFYLFNPYSEDINVVRPSSEPTIADYVHYQRCIEHTRVQLAQARPGTRVVTYFGFGGELPPGFERQQVEDFGCGRLELWVKK